MPVLQAAAEQPVGVEADAEVVLSVVDDKGLIMPTLRTNEHGWADATYTAGGTECLVQIQASAGNATGTASFIQSPDTVTWSSHPRSGSDSLRGLEETWAAAVAASQSAAVAEPSEPETTE